MLQKLFRVFFCLLRLRSRACQKLLPRLFRDLELLCQLGTLLRQRAELFGKRVVICLRLSQALLQPGQLYLHAGVFCGELIALVGQLPQRLLVLDGGRFDIIDNVGAVEAADRRAEF